MPLWLSRLSWFVGLWTASVTTMLIVGGFLRLWLR